MPISTLAPGSDENQPLIPFGELSLTPQGRKLSLEAKKALAFLVIQMETRPEKGGSFEIKTQSEQQFFHAFVKKDSREMKRVLQKYPYLHNPHGNNPLHQAILYKKIEALKPLLHFDKSNGNAMINAKNKSGYAPIHLAILTLNMESITHLIQEGCDLSVLDSKGNTPSKLAAQKLGENHPITQILFKHL